MDVPCKVTHTTDAPTSLSVIGRRQAVVSCTRCGQCVSGADSDRGIARSLVMLRNTCPRGERNWYVREHRNRDPSS